MSEKMTLPEWMRRNGKRPADLEKATGCSRANASRLSRGLITPGKELGDKIIAWTDGAVDWNTLMVRQAA